MEARRKTILRRSFELSVGIFTWKLLDHVFDFVLYPFMIWKLGAVQGGIVMSLLSLTSCLAMLRLYDRLGTDWLGIEFIKDLKKYEGNSWWRQKLAGVMNYGNLPAFFLLSVYYDPFITTAYLRNGSYNGMAKKDWLVFFASWFVSNGTWLLLCIGGVWFLG